MIRYRMLEGGHPGAPEWASEWSTATDRLDDMHKVRQAVFAGHAGRARWAEDKSGRLLFGLDAKGKEMRVAVPPPPPPPRASPTTHEKVPPTVRVYRGWTIEPSEGVWLRGHGLKPKKYKGYLLTHTEDGRTKIVDTLKEATAYIDDYMGPASHAAEWRKPRGAKRSSRKSRRSSRGTKRRSRR